MPTPQTPRALQFENAGRQHGAERVAAEHAEEEDGDALGELLLPVPCRERIARAGDVTRLGQAERHPRYQEARLVPEEYLQGRDQTEKHHLRRDVLAGTDLWRVPR